MASASIDEEPVKTAPAVLATAIRKFAPRANRIDLSESAPADIGPLCRCLAACSGLEQILDPIAPGLGRRRMPVARLAERFVELLEELALVLRQLDRRLDADVAVQVAR